MHCLTLKENWSSFCELCPYIYALLMWHCNYRSGKVEFQFLSLLFHLQTSSIPNSTVFPWLSWLVSGYEPEDLIKSLYPWIKTLRVESNLSWKWIRQFWQWWGGFPPWYLWWEFTVRWNVRADSRNIKTKFKWKSHKVLLYMFLSNIDSTGQSLSCTGQAPSNFWKESTFQHFICRVMCVK